MKGCVNTLVGAHSLLVCQRAEIENQLEEFRKSIIEYATDLRVNDKVLVPDHADFNQGMECDVIRIDVVQGERYKVIATGWVLGSKESCLSTWQVWPTVNKEGEVK